MSDAALQMSHHRVSIMCQSATAIVLHIVGTKYLAIIRCKSKTMPSTSEAYDIVGWRGGGIFYHDFNTILLRSLAANIF